MSFELGVLSWELAVQLAVKSSSSSSSLQLEVGSLQWYLKVAVGSRQ